MIEYILLAAIAAVIVLLLFLRTNAAVCFLALCAGSVLLSMSGENMDLITSLFTSGNNSSASISRIIFLFLPLVVCVALLRGHVSKGLMPLNFLPAVCIATLGVLLVVPELSGSTSSSIMMTETWSLLTQFRELIVGGGIVVSIVLLSITVKHPHAKHKKSHH